MYLILYNSIYIYVYFLGVYIICIYNMYIYIYMYVCVCTVYAFVIASDFAYFTYRVRSSPKVRTPTGGWISAPGKEGAVLLNLGEVFSGGLDDKFL